MPKGFQGWEPPAPVSEQLFESSIMEITSDSLTNEELVITNARFDHRLSPKTLPERISVVMTEPFLGIDAKICVGRVNQAKEDELYLNWTELPNYPYSFQQKPESIFIPPDESNHVIRLSFRLRGDDPPKSGRILFFIKHRLI
jgi:hypothetical protein